METQVVIAQEAQPFDAVARINEDGGMVKLLAAPMLVIAGVVVLITIVRFFQAVRERIVTDRSFRD